MEQHPIPRQITTFEFKLIGFMTLKQFMYLVVLIPIGALVARLFPIPIINILIGISIAGLGFALAFIPINDRPMDVWIRNLARRLFSPTQYKYHKENSPVYFFQKLFFDSDPHKVVAHVESAEKLRQYLAKTQQQGQAGVARKNQITQILKEPPLIFKQKASPTQSTTAPIAAGATTTTSVAARPAATLKKPALVGVVKNRKQIPLPGMLIYIKNPTGQPVRLLKTNPHGIFATYSPLDQGEYTFEVQDPKGAFFFDTMKFNISSQSNTPVEFVSKEML